MTAQLKEVNRLRKRGYEIAHILRRGCLMIRVKDDAMILVARNGRAARVNT